MGLYRRVLNPLPPLGNNVPPAHHDHYVYVAHLGQQTQELVRRWLRIVMEPDENLCLCLSRRVYRASASQPRIKLKIMNWPKAVVEHFSRTYGSFIDKQDVLPHLFAPRLARSGP